jgi:Methyltransferase domain
MHAAIRSALKSRVLDVFRLSLKSGLIVLPKHYYAPVADINELARTRATWAKRSRMPGVTMDLDEQINFLRDKIAPFQSEYLGNKTYIDGTRSGFGPGFGFLEAQAYHGFLRSMKPKRIIEVGSGVSTHCAIAATKANASETGEATEIICIEPNPSPFIRESRDITVKANRVEEVPVELFESLSEGDLLFIDSTHAVRPGGDVIYLYCEVLPRLRPGVRVHIHDIYFPYTYQPDLLDSLFHWSESCMLQTLLVNNSRLKILLCMSMLHYDAPDALKEAFPEYRRAHSDDGLYGNDRSQHFPTSIYLEVT